MAKKKMTKKEYSDKINEMLKLTGDSVIDWTRLKEGDLLEFYVMLTLNNSVSIPETSAEKKEPADDAPLPGGILGFGFLDGSMAKTLVGSRENKRALLRKVMDNVDAEDLQKIAKRHPVLAELMTATLEKAAEK